MKKKDKKKIAKLEARVLKLEAKPKVSVNTIGFQQLSEAENEYDDCGQLSWVDAKHNGTRK